MAEQSLVSVLICTYNANKYVENTLDSVLDQTYDNLEILVLDNDSSDDTVDIVRSYMDRDSRIELFELNENLGNYPGHNYLLERATGDYVAIQDHDDVWHPEKVRMQVEFLDDNPEFVGCGGLAIKLWEGTDKIHQVTFDEVGHFSPHPSLMFRNDGYTYDTSLKYKTDTYFMNHILCDGEDRLYNFQKPLYVSLVRMDGNNMTKNRIPLQDIAYYSYRSGNVKLLLNQLRHLISPFRTYPMNNIDRIWNEAELRSVRTLTESEFTEAYVPYITDYTDSDLKA